MLRKDLEKYLGKKVKIMLSNGSVIEGELHKTFEEMFKNNPDLYYPSRKYFCINPQSCLFRCSYVKKIKVIYDWEYMYDEAENLIKRYIPNAEVNRNLRTVTHGMPRVEFSFKKHGNIRRMENLKEDQHFKSFGELKIDRKVIVFGAIVFNPDGKLD